MISIKVRSVSFKNLTVDEVIHRKGVYTFSYANRNVGKIKYVGTGHVFQRLHALTRENHQYAWNGTVSFVEEWPSEISEDLILQILEHCYIVACRDTNRGPIDNIVDGNFNSFLLRMDKHLETLAKIRITGDNPLDPYGHRRIPLQKTFTIINNQKDYEVSHDYRTLL
jgi:hypothetical protein